jgi:uncharacterized protein (TIGR02300 family)
LGAAWRCASRPSLAISPRRGNSIRRRVAFAFDRAVAAVAIPACGPGVPAREKTEQDLSKAEWGTKRICPSCGTRYYDFGRALGAIKCPKCGTEFDPEAFLKTRRARAPAPVEKEVVPVVAEEAEAEPGLDADEAEVVEEGEGAETEGEEEEEEVIEDASELGEDEDDMAEVIENVEDEEER